MSIGAIRREAHLPSFFPAWIKEYNGQKFHLDLFAGLSTALFALPQCMAYAMLAGIDPKHGLYAVIVGAVLGSLFGSSRHLHTGPVNSAAILTASTMALYIGDSHFMAMVFLLTMLAGIFQLTAGLIRLGNMTQFISRSVLEGFVAAAGLLIVINQLPNLLGIPSHSSVSILAGLRHAFINILDFRLEALGLGLATIFIIFVLNKISPKSSNGVPIIPAYLIAILVTAGLVVAFGLQTKGIAVVGEIPKSLPSFSLPVFNPALMKALAPGALAIALIGVAESITIGKSIASRVDERIDPDRELIGQGIAKIGASFFSGMPVSGSFTRTTLNYRIGSATRFANIYSAVILSLTILVFGRFVQYIPVAALAGILIFTCANIVNWQHARLALRTTRSDALAMLGTFAGALIYPLDKAVFIGVGISLILFLRKVQVPRFSELIYDETAGFQELKNNGSRAIPEISIIHIEGDVFFGAADALQEQVSKIAKREELEVLILRMKRACCLDATGILGLIKLHEDLQKRGKLLLISGATGEVEYVLLRSGVDKIIGIENIFFSDETILKSTREAVLRAIDHVNQKSGKQYRVRLFFDRPDPAITAPEK